MPLTCKRGHIKTKDNLVQSSRCKICRYNRQRESRKRLLEARYRFINQLKSLPCTDCNIAYHPFLMDFDHVRGKKYRNISKMIDHNSWKKVLKEIRKCEIVCSNCHRKRTLDRMRKKLSTGAY